MAMIDVIRADEMTRLCGLRPTSDCDDVVVDFSRNRSRKFCSTTCGNREAQAAFRARQGAARPVCTRKPRSLGPDTRRDDIVRPTGRGVRPA